MDAAEISFEAIGTRWTIEAQANPKDMAWRKLERAIHARIETFDKTYSRFRDDSLVLGQWSNPGTYALPADAHALLSFYERLYKATDGKVTPLIGQMMSDAGYDKQYGFQTQTLQHPPAWEGALHYTKHTITLARPVILDFGAAGKGYLVDIVGNLLRESGVKGYCVNAGGDILYKAAGGQVMEVGLENPRNLDEAIGIATLHNQSICGSAGSRRAWGAYHHIIDPDTLMSPRTTIATWVVAADAMTADGVATALFFTEPSKLARHFSFSYALLRDDMSLERSSTFPARVFGAAEK